VHARLDPLAAASMALRDPEQLDPIAELLGRLEVDRQ
jgi:hypothetical protein